MGGTKAVSSMIKAPHSTPDALAARITGWRSKCAASIGKAARRSRTAKAARKTAAATAKAARVRVLKASHCTSAAIPAPTPQASRALPSRSTPPCRAGRGGSVK
jgi:hypothetical protein